VRPLAQAAGDEHLLFLARGVSGHIFIELRAAEIQLAQDRLAQAFVNAAGRDIVAQAAPQKRGLLRHIGYC